METKRKLNLWKLLPLLPCVILFTVVLSLSWSNKSIVWGLTKEALTWLSPSILTENLETNLSDGLQERYDYIELNGAMTKALGIHTLNGRQLLENGYLAQFPWLPLDGEAIEETARLAAVLEEQGIGVLCAPMGLKAYFHDVAVAPGYDSTGPEQYRRFSEAMAATGMPYLDLMAWFEENGWSMEDTYFRSDHHWRPEAAFAAAQQIMADLSERYGLSADLDLQDWNLEIYPDWFLGSESRRTGASYGGMDDLPYLYPKNMPVMQVGRITASGHMEMECLDTVYDTTYLEAPVGYKRSAYCLYLGGDFPLISIRNPQGLNDKKILVIGDSYRLPLECFLATQFTELYHIDQRHYQDGTIAAYIFQIQPDIVLLTGLPGTVTENVGLRDWEQTFAGKTVTETVVQVEEIQLDQTESAGDFYLLAANLNPGAYTLTMDRGVLTGNGEQPCGDIIQFALVDLKSGAVVSSRYFLTEYEEPQKWLLTVPEKDGANYAVVIYNGMRFQTQGNAASIQGVTLTALS